MDPDMADLALQRRLRRPKSGMPSDWAIDPSPPATATSPTSPDDDLYYEGSRGEVGEPLDGVLNLDEILGTNAGAREEDRTGEVERRQQWRRETGSEQGTSARNQGRRINRPRTQPRRGEDDYYLDDFYKNNDYDYSNNNGYWDEEEEAQQRSRRRGGGGERERAKSKRKLNPAERYELKIRGDGRGGGAGDTGEEEASIWTGVGPDGPWPR